MVAYSSIIYVAIEYQVFHFIVLRINMWHIHFQLYYRIYSILPPIFFPGLFPAVLNLATSAVITTNATCGEKEPEMYCKLVEHVSGQPARNPQCRICHQDSKISHRMYAILVLFC